MKLYRITKVQYASNLSGKGAELYGGRWNSPGNKVVYTSAHASLALLETLAWTSMATLLAAGFVMIVIDCPKSSIEEISALNLPDGWNHLDAYPVTQKIGDNWLRKGDTLLFRVPSAILPMESNFLINPSHAQMSEIEIDEVFDLHLDPRILKSIE